MLAQFYSFNGDPRVVEKTFDETSAAVDIKPYTAVSDLRGYIIVSADYQSYNYVRLTIAGKQKYFFVTSKLVDTAGRLTMQLSEDVLMTWCDQILNTDCMVSKSNVGANPYFANDLPCLVYSRHSETAAASLEYDHNGDLYFVLVTAGGSVKTNSGLVTEQPNWTGW